MRGRKSQPHALAGKSRLLFANSCSDFASKTVSVLHCMFCSRYIFCVSMLFRERMFHFRSIESVFLCTLFVHVKRKKTGKRI